jgi:hypothetical protein
VRDENAIKLKRAYWSGVYYALNPAERLRSEKSQKEWLTAEVWLTALDWILGQATDSATTLRKLEDTKDWDI